MESSSGFLGGAIGTSLTALGAAMSITEIQALISIIFTVIGGTLTIISTVIIPFIKRIRKAKADGKITAEEIDKIIDDTQKDIADVKEKLDK